MAKPKLKPLNEQVIVITGASSGIGRVTAKAAAARGARLMLVARNEASLREVVNEISASGGNAAYCVADVGDPQQLEAAAQRAIDVYGRIDTWVSNAGTAIYAKLIDTPIDEHQRLFQTNYFGAVNSASVAIPHLREHGGALIFTGSIASELPSPILSAYSASKHAVKGFVDALRMELKAVGFPIGVTLIKPSGIDTPIAQRAANHVDGEALIPVPVYDPELVANAILDATQRVRREVTVGGMGRLQVLLGNHFPEVLDRLAGPLSAMMFDPEKEKTGQASIFEPLQPGRDRSGVQPGRRFSVYGTPRRRRALAAAAAATGLILMTRNAGKAALAQREIGRKRI